MSFFNVGPAFFYGGVAYTAPSIVQFVGNTTGSSTTSLAAPPISVSAGNSLFVIVGNSSAVVTTLGVTDSSGNTYVPLSNNQTAVGTSCRWFYCLNPIVDPANVITATSSVGTTLSVGVHRSDTQGLMFVSQSNVNSGAAAVASLTSGSFTTTSPAFLLTAYFCTGSTTNITFTDGIVGNFFGLGAGGANRGKAGVLASASGFSSEQITAAPALSRVSVLSTIMFITTAPPPGSTYVDPGYVSSGYVE